MLLGLEKTARRGEKSAKVFVQIYYFKICIAQIKTEMVNLKELRLSWNASGESDNMRVSSAYKRI